MKQPPTTPDDYANQLPPDKKQTINKLRQTIQQNLPPGFQETIQYAMITYVIPHSLYPKGYHTNPKDPLPFLAIASQKNHTALYHMALYSYPHLLTWFLQEYPKHTTTKPDIGKSCIRFKNPNTIPYDLIAQLCQKITPQDYINHYEQTLQQHQKTKQQNTTKQQQNKNEK